MTKKYSLKEIAGFTGAQIKGDSSFIAQGVAPLETAGRNDICLARSAEYIKKISESYARTFIVSEDPGIEGINCIIHSNPYAVFAKIIALFYPLEFKDKKIDETASVGNNLKKGKNVFIGANAVTGSNVSLGDNVYIYPGTVIGDNVEIGDDSRIYSNVTVYSGCIIGSNVIIHSGSVIGSDGFGFAPDSGSWVKINHTGRVVIKDNAEIGACNTIDKGTFSDTVLGKSVKTDNQVHIAHNVEIGDNTILVGQSGVAGSTKIGKNCIIAGKAGISGHLNIGDNVMIGPAAGITSDVKSGTVVSGLPQMPHKLWLKVQNIITRLPDMRKKLFSLEKKIEEMEKRKNGQS
ncbi:MAG: UDP-3-O-(3-hydroxymyristoyl)glucosamine N-acyltransferase [Thermodesulfobacteriota bacterium]